MLLLTLFMVWNSDQKLMNQFFSKMHQEGCGGTVLAKILTQHKIDDCNTDTDININCTKMYMK